eukprot:EG_transcript_15878
MESRLGVPLRSPITPERPGLLPPPRPRPERLPALLSEAQGRLGLLRLGLTELVQRPDGNVVAVGQVMEEMERELEGLQVDTSLQQDTLERCHAEHEAAMAEMRRELAATVRLFRAAEQDLGGMSERIEELQSSGAEWRHSLAELQRLAVACAQRQRLAAARDQELQHLRQELQRALSAQGSSDAEDIVPDAASLAEVADFDDVAPDPAALASQPLPDREGLQRAQLMAQQSDAFAALAQDFARAAVWLAGAPEGHAGMEASLVLKAEQLEAEVQSLQRQVAADRARLALQQSTVEALRRRLPGSRGSDAGGSPFTPRVAAEAEAIGDSPLRPRPPRRSSTPRSGVPAVPLWAAAGAEAAPAPREGAWRE